jgi:hypothetical protein
MVFGNISSLLSKAILNSRGDVRRETIPCHRISKPEDTYTGTGLLKSTNVIPTTSINRAAMSDEDFSG